jgi:hypothetical protein
VRSRSDGAGAPATSSVVHQLSPLIGVIKEPDARSMPGTAPMASAICWYKSRVLSAGVVLRAALTVITTTGSASNPSGAAANRVNVRTKSPAATTRMVDNATCATRRTLETPPCL